MQYLLTEEEYNHLVKEANKAASLPSLEALQELCTFVANKLPIKVDWKDEIEPWGCILTEEGEWYCDDCPSQKFCPYTHKEWSK